jgi:hypothetical protein
MPHDKNGTLLKEGDVVTITGRVKALQPGTEYCNASVELDPMPPYTTPYTLTLNTNQMVKSPCVGVGSEVVATQGLAGAAPLPENSESTDA